MQKVCGSNLARGSVVEALKSQSHVEAVLDNLKTVESKGI